MKIQRVRDLWAGLTAIPSPAHPVKVDVGDQATVPEWTWVTVLNEQPVWNANIAYRKGMTAGIEYGGTVTVVEIHYSTVIVRYNQPDDTNRGGTNCPRGALFELQSWDFATMTDRYDARRKMIESENALVKSLLSQNIWGPEQIITSDSFWIDIVNTSPIRNANVKFEYGDCAVVHKRGTIRSRGTANGRTLFMYTTDRRTAGTQCPSGALFFVLNEAQLAA